MIMSIFLYIMYILLIYWGLLAVMFALVPLSRFDSHDEPDTNMSRSVSPSDRMDNNDSDTDDDGYNSSCSDRHSCDFSSRNGKNDTCIDTNSKTTHRRSLHRCDD